MSDDEGLSESTWQTLEPNQSHTQPDLRDAWYRCSCWWMTNWQVEIYPQCFLLCRSILHTCDYMAADWLHPPSAKFLLPLPNLSSLRPASPPSTQPLLPPPSWSAINDRLGTNACKKHRLYYISANTSTNTFANTNTNTNIWPIPIQQSINTNPNTYTYMIMIPIQIYYIPTSIQYSINTNTNMILICGQSRTNTNPRGNTTLVGLILPLSIQRCQ